MLHAFVLSIGAVNALVPVMIIIILIAAAAGATRGFTLFNVFTISTFLSGTGSVGGGSRGSASRSGYPLRAFLDPGGKYGAKRQLTTAKFERVKGEGTRKNVAGRIEELIGSSKTAARKKALEVREGERQAGLQGREKGAHSENSKKGVKLVAESVPMYRQKGAFGRQRPHPRVVEPRMEREAQELKEHIGKIKKAGGGDRGARVLVAEKLKEIGEPGEDNRKIGTLTDEIAVLQVGERGLRDRLRLVEEHINKVAIANEELGKGRITDEEHRRRFARSMNRLYGAPDKSIVHNLFNPNYGNSIENIGAKMAEKAEGIRFAGKVGVYVAASVPAAIAATMESIYKKGFDKSYEPRFETHYTRPKRPRDVLGAIYDVQKKAYENYARSSYDPKAFSRRWAKEMEEKRLRATVLKRRKEEGK